MAGAAEAAEAIDAVPPLQEPDGLAAAMAVATLDSNVPASSPTLAIDQPEPPTQGLTEPASWNTIPTELKLHILSFNLVVKGRINAWRHDKVSKRMKLTDLMLTSKEMHDLAAGVYYGSNTFQISASYGGVYHFLQSRKTGPDDFSFRVPNLAIGKFVRRLEFHVDVGDFLNYGRAGEELHKPNLRLPGRVKSEPSLLCLIEPFEGGNAWRERHWEQAGLRSQAFAPSAQWQYAFPALSYLKVVLEKCPCLYKGMGIGERRMKAVLDMPKYARVPLQPLQVEVVAVSRLVSCHQWERVLTDHFWSKKCERKDCVEMLRKSVESMIQTRTE